MAVTIPELDNAVRSFYEGRGEQVRRFQTLTCAVLRLQAR